MKDLKEYTAFIYDNGLFPELASKMAEQYGTVYYYSNYKSAFPKSKLAKIGEGLKGVERVEDFWDYFLELDKEKTDFIFPDIGDGDLQHYLKSEGCNVWGCDYGEDLEMERGKYRKLCEQIGLNMPKYVIVTGVDGLREELKGTKNRFVKTTYYRGDMETFHHQNDETTEPYLKWLEYYLGALADSMEFVIDDAVGEIEPGYDGFTINGQFPEITGWGYEVKDKSYIGKVCRYSNLPKQIIEVNEKLSPIFKKYDVRGYFSSEVRIDKRRKGYPLDLCMRGGNPPLDLMLELYNNWAEIIHFGAQGIIITPRPVKRYGAMAIIQSEWSDKQWQTITFPEEDRRWYKFKNVIKKNNEYWIVPIEQGLYEIGSVIGLGNTSDEAIEQVKNHAKNIQGYDIDININALNEAKDIIKEGQKYGLNF